MENMPGSIKLDKCFRAYDENCRDANVLRLIIKLN